MQPCGRDALQAAARGVPPAVTCSVWLEGAHRRVLSQHPAGTLPDAWGAPGAFPRLEELYLGWNNSFTGSLPASWGSPTAFQNLMYM